MDARLEEAGRVLRAEVARGEALHGQEAADVVNGALAAFFAVVTEVQQEDK